MKFTELGLKPEILKALEEMDYTELTPVQEQTFGHIMSGRDMIARAETGSGKTGACAVPIVQAVDLAVRAIQALVLVPTRELALQYVEEIGQIAERTAVRPFAVYGGFSSLIQKSKLEHGVHILVATPGRLIDLLRNTSLSLAEVRTFVLDEADEMLNMGFIDDVEFILSCLVHEHQTLLFAATMPTEIKRLSKTYLRDPITIELNEDQIAPVSLQHCFGPVTRGDHFARLVAYLEAEQPVQAIVFCNSKRNVDQLYKDLSKKVKSVEYIHGDLEQGRRTSLYNRFRAKRIKVMVATDIASRGLDFSQVSHVINYDFPLTCEAYTHRTGRTARMGRKGVAMTFYGGRDLADLKEMIRTNHIEPIWHGGEPDFSRTPRKKPYRGGRPGGYSGKKRPPHRNKGAGR